MPLGLFSRVGAPSYSHYPVHFLSLDTTKCGRPLYGPIPSEIVVTTVMWCLVLEEIRDTPTPARRLIHLPFGSSQEVH